MVEHDRALAFENVAVQFLPVAVIGNQIQQIILNLERRAEKKTEANERDRDRSWRVPIIAPTWLG
jgi:hypothetical protein